MTRIALRLLLVALAALAAGCAPDAQKDAVVFDRVLPRPEPTMVRYVHEVHVPAAATQPSPSEIRALERFLVEHEVSRRDEIAIVTGVDDRLNGTDQARHRALAHILEQRGLRVVILPGAFDAMPQAPAMVRVAVHRTLVTLPGCPDWSGPTNVDGQNQPYSNFGCADAMNLGLMVARPSDLAGGRPSGALDAEYGAAAVERYRQGKIKPLDSDAANPSPVTINMSQSSGGGGQ